MSEIKMSEAIKKAIQNMICKKHNKNPDFKIVGTDLHFSCCCNEFKKEVTAVAKNAVSKYAMDEIKRSFEGLGK